MKITVKLFATLRNYGENICEMEVGDDATPLTVMHMMRIPSQEVSIVMINGKRVNEQTSLKQADTVALFPPVGGG